MSFLGFGQPKPTSAEKIAAVENELKVVAEMHSR
jgi:import inner membrane translocase subunit TIM10